MALGMSAALRGNGMCLSTRGLARVPWQTHGLTEDLEYSWMVRIAGGRITFDRGAAVHATMLRQGGSGVAEPASAMGDRPRGAPQEDVSADPPLGPPSSHREGRVPGRADDADDRVALLGLSHTHRSLAALRLPELLFVSGGRLPRRARALSCDRHPGPCAPVRQPVPPGFLTVAVRPLPPPRPVLRILEAAGGAERPAADLGAHPCASPPSARSGRILPIAGGRPMVPVRRADRPLARAADDRPY